MKANLSAKIILVVFCVFCVSLVIPAQIKKPRAVKRPVVIKTPSSVQPMTSDELSKFEQEILTEINLLRSDPKSYAKILEDMRSSMDGKVAVFPGIGRIEMKEGAAAISEAINDLKKTGKLEAVGEVSGMSRAAKDQLKNLMEDISLQHSGNDGSDFAGRLLKYGSPGIMIGEIISLYSKTAREAILQMLIDDGLKSRIHRINLLNPQYRMVGIAYGVGKNKIEICVIDFADKFTNH